MQELYAPNLSDVAIHSIPATTTYRDLPVSVEAPGQARRIVETIGDLAPYPDLRFAAQLLTSELIANSVRHAGLGADQSISLCVACCTEMVRVEVTDGGPGFDALHVLADHRRNDERSHGIFLVNGLADRWGYRSGDQGWVWFEIDFVPGRRPWRGRESISAHRHRSV